MTKIGLARLFFFTPIFLLVSGLTPSALQLILSSRYLLYFLEVSHHLNSSSTTLRIMTIFIPLVVVFILACVIICLTNFLPATFLAFSWVIVPLIKSFVVLIPPPLSYTSPHAQFDETLFLVVLGSEAQSFSSLHVSNFLELHLYHIDSSPPLYHFFTAHSSIHSSSSCDICSDLVDESVQVDTSLAELLCHSRLLICPLLNLLLIPLLLWALIL